MSDGSENGRLASVSNTVSGITCSYRYDLMDRATNITYRTANGSLIRSLDYAYDAASMITNKVQASGNGQEARVAYTYDSLNRLVGESSFTNGSSLFDIHYSYDLAGNRLTKTTDGLGVAYTLGTGNRLASARTIGVIDMQGTSTEPIGTDDRWGELWVSNLTAQVGWVPEFDGQNFWADDMPLEIGTNQLVAAIRDQAGNTDYTTNTVFLSASSTNMQYGYDAAGCMTNLNGVSLEWDERYRLKSVDMIAPADSNLSSFVEYEYDVLNRRRSRTEGGTTNYFVYNGNQVVADLDESGELLRTYVWGQGIDNLLCFTDHTTSNTYYAIKDHQNTVIALVDDAGSVVESYEYDAYGNTKVFNASGTEISESAVGNRYCFQGREYDSTTGLYYFRARWYDPGTGRWLSKDTVGIAGGLNLYVAFGNNPINATDPFGEDWSVGGSAGGTFVVGGGVGVSGSFSVGSEGISGSITVTREEGVRVSGGASPTVQASKYDAGNQTYNAGFGLFGLFGNAGNVGATYGKWDIGFSRSTPFWQKGGGTSWKDLWNAIKNKFSKDDGDDC